MACRRSYLDADQRVKLNPLLAFLMSVEQIIVVLFLVWYGLQDCVVLSFDSRGSRISGDDRIDDDRTRDEAS